MYTLLQVGTDAEVFLKSREGIPVPVFGMLGGSKLEPKKVPELGEGFAVQEDNVMAEFNIPACYTKEAFDSSIAKMLGHLSSTFLNKYGLLLDISSSKNFDEDSLLHPQAIHFGCEPDYCAWTKEQNELDRENPALRTLRTAAAHVHVSFERNDGEKIDMEDRITVVKLLDVFLGVPATIIDDPVRKQFYGKAGAFRPKPYGVEYRTLGNFWIQSSEYRRWVFSQAARAIDFSSSDVISSLLSRKSTERLVQTCINKNNLEAYNYLMDSFSILSV